MNVSRNRRRLLAAFRYRQHCVGHGGWDGRHSTAMWRLFVRLEDRKRNAQQARFRRLLRAGWGRREAWRATDSRTTPWIIS